MARFTPNELFDELHGKLSGKSKYYAAEKYGTQYTGKIGEITVLPTEKQTQVRSLFASTSQKLATLTEEELAAYAVAFNKAPGKYKSLRGYIFAQERKKLE